MECHRRVIGGALHAPSLAVDAHLDRAGEQLRGHEVVVDPQAVVLPEAVGAVVPPGVPDAGGVEARPRVRQAEVESILDEFP